MNYLMIASALAFLAAVLAVVGVMGLANQAMVVNERRWTLAKRDNESTLEAAISLVKQVLLEQGMRLLTVERIYGRLKKDVVRANYPETAEEYLGSALLEGLIVALVGIVFCLFLFGPASLLIPLLLGGAWGLWIRPSLAEGDGEKRARAVYRRIPYALDLGVLVLQTGGTLRDALEVAAQTDDPLADELQTAFKEIDAGASEAVALRNMSDRVGLETLETIVLAINRGAETGAPMAQTLTTQAELFREKRLQEVEKLAVEAPTKMTFPNMMVMLAVLLLVVGPLLVKLTDSGLV
jgi:tight adherence protein C